MPTKRLPAGSRTTAGRSLRDARLGFLRIHILHRAAEQRIRGLETMEELRRHGYDIGPGTLYPLLHGLEGGGIVASTLETVDGKVRRHCRTTAAGDALLIELRAMLRERVDEVLPGAARRKSSRPAGRRHSR
jgi:PadR family transcriptional regulator, regulatory protein PadR